MYGMVVAYRYTEDPRFLAMAIRLSDYFLSHLPEDRVANWDFQSDVRYRDASAACIAASALLEMIDYVENTSLRQRYREEAEAMLTSLCSSPYFAAGVNTNCLLEHSVHFLPANSNVDVPAIFADYYFLEALLRYRAHHSTATR
jgi:unsaturated chondroitin disaccharide hydrolase